MGPIDVKALVAAVMQVALLWPSNILQARCKRVHVAKYMQPVVDLYCPPCFQYYIMFAMLIRLVLDGAGLGIGEGFGGELASDASWTRLTGLCGGG